MHMCGLDVCESVEYLQYAHTCVCVRMQEYGVPAVCAHLYMHVCLDVCESVEYLQCAHTYLCVWRTEEAVWCPLPLSPLVPKMGSLSDHEAGLAGSRAQ